MTDRNTKDKMTEKEMLKASLAAIDNALMYETMDEKRRIALEKEFAAKYEKLKSLK